MFSTGSLWLRRAATLLGLTLVALQGASTSAQQASPWTGIATDEARAWDGEVHSGTNATWFKALSGDARYVVFYSSMDLLPTDTNNTGDIYLRDRATGLLTLISVATDGTQGDSFSADASISADGRHVGFISYATNLVAGDSNGVADVFVRDQVLNTTVLASIGPNGEAATYIGSQGRLSADGRYVAFVANFDPDPMVHNRAWLRDRDPDANGVFDEPGLATTTQINVSTVGTSELFYVIDIAISSDARWVAYVAGTVADYQYVGTRLFLYDRLTATTARVDTPLPESPDEWAETWMPDFSDAGHLVYVSGASNLVAGDTNGADDVFVADLTAGTQSLIALTHVNAPVLARATRPAISADGRYVAFVGVEDSPEGELHNTYAVDRQLNQSYEISVRPDGTRDNLAFNPPSFSADASAIAFSGLQPMLVNGDWTFGVFVATSVALSPAETDVPEAGGTYTLDLTTPANTAWTLDFGANVTVTPSTGVGPATIEITIPANTSGEGATTAIVLGSEHAVFRQVNTERVTTELALAEAGAFYGGVGSLQATLTGGGSPLAGRDIAFFVGNAAAGTATTGSNGEVVLGASLAGLNTGEYPIRAEFAGDSTALPSAADSVISIYPAVLSLRTTNVSKVYGQALPAFTVTGMGFVNGDTVASLGGTAAFSTSATATSVPGTYSVTPGGLTSSNYYIYFQSGLLTVTRAATAVAFTTTPKPSQHNQPVLLRAVVSVVAPGAGTLVGSVQFRDNGAAIGSANLVNGVATLVRPFTTGIHSLTATYSGTNNFLTSAMVVTHQVQ